MAAKRKKRVVRRTKQPQSIISDDIFIPNHSGMLDAGKVHRVATDDLDPVNKKYVDDKFPVTHASTTGQTTDDHHAISHIHDGVDGSGTVTHANTTGKTANDHHNELHTIASHSDTNATGAELDTLTDNSMADTLHRHSELSASDGNPDAAFFLDAGGTTMTHTAFGVTHLLRATSGGSGDAQLQLRNAGGGGANGANFMYDTGTVDLFIENTAISDSSDIVFRLRTSGTPEEVMRLTPTATGREILIDANVGIGTDFPDVLLHVESATSAALVRIETTGANTIANYQMVNDVQTWALGVDGTLGDSFKIQDQTNGKTPFKIEPSTPDNTLYLDSSGNIGIGTDSPNANLVVSDGGLTGFEFLPDDGNNRGTIALFDRGEIEYKDLRIDSKTLSLRTGPTSSVTEALNINSDGLVTIPIDLETTGRVKAITTKTANYTATTTDDVILCNGTFTITLPTASGDTGRIFCIKNISNGTITLDANATETIDGDLTQSLLEDESMTIINDGSNWFII